MHRASGNVLPWAEWGLAGEPLKGEPESADRGVVVPTPKGAVLAVVDGLGHGALAVVAAKKAIETIELHGTEPVLDIFQACHAALAGTRGAVMTLVELDGPGASLTWAGVGDVEAALHSFRGKPRQAVPLMPGVLGDRISRLKPQAVPIEAGDVLVLATDGLKRAFMNAPVLHDAPPAAAERLLTQHARGTDDALVLVVRYNGP